MTRTREWTGALAAALLACAGGAWADTTIRFDSVDAKAKAPVSLLGSVREATKGIELPAIQATKDAVSVKTAAKTAAPQPGQAAATTLAPGVQKSPAFWGSDGNWCPDGQRYYGGPCDNSWGGYRDPYRDPYYRGPYRSPYDDPNQYRNPWGSPYRNPYSSPYRRNPWGW